MSAFSPTRASSNTPNPMILAKLQVKFELLIRHSNMSEFALARETLEKRVSPWEMIGKWQQTKDH